MQDLNNEPVTDTLMNGIMTANDDIQPDESLSLAQSRQPNPDIGKLKTLSSLLGNAMIGKTAVGISLLSAICLGSFVIMSSKS